jgi:hypothetical protein
MKCLPVLVEWEFRFSTVGTMSIRLAVVRRVPMRLIIQIRALITLIVLASNSPLGLAIAQVDWGTHGSHLGISLFIGRFTRVAAAQQFDPSRAAVSRCPSRFVRQSVTCRLPVSGDSNSISAECAAK